MLTLGRHSYVGEYRELFDPVVIVGNFCSLASFLTFQGADNHRTDLVSTYPFIEKGFHSELEGYSTAFSKGPITIKNDVWVGQGATFLSGVTIGNGAVIGAKTVVAKDLEDYGIYVGNPARLVRHRFAPEIVEKLRQIAWWDWDDAIIKENIKLFYRPIEEFIDAFGQSK